MTASTAAFSLTPAFISLASHSSMAAPLARWAATARRALARAFTATAVEGVVQSGTEERDNRVTAVFLIGRQGGHTAHPCSMTRSPVGTRSNLQAACADGGGECTAIGSLGTEGVVGGHAALPAHRRVLRAG
jgi:hypothetical protein